MLDARRRAILDALGIDVWRLRTQGPGARSEDAVSRAADQGPGTKADESTADRVAGNSPPAAESTGVAPPPPIPSALPPEPSALSWEQLHATVRTCAACALHETRTQTVFGVGNQSARLMVIGEAPGAEEDRQGEPFVGRAGQLLNAMLAAIGFPRDQVYIANIVKCRPPGNRDPGADETAACRAYLLRQIELVAPELILAVGRVAAHSLLGTDEAVGRLRGRTHRLDPGDIPVLVTYHPAYLLRQPQEKAKSWQDLQAAWHLLREG